MTSAHEVARSTAVTVMSSVDTVVGSVTGTSYVPVCRLEDIEVEGGVAALVHGDAVAVFRTHDGAIHALSNYDPCARASVLARGIVGTRGDVPFVASPMYKQAFDLRSGQCLDDAAVRVPVFEVEISGGMVLVGGRKGADSS